MKRKPPPSKSTLELLDLHLPSQSTLLLSPCNTSVRLLVIIAKHPSPDLQTTQMQQELECGDVPPLSQRDVNMHTRTLTHARHACHRGAPPALPFPQPQGSRAPELGHGAGCTQKPLFHPAQQRGRRGARVSLLSGGSYFGNPLLSCCSC